MTQGELEKYTATLARALKVTMPKGVGFTLMLFDFATGGYLAYASTAEREDMIKTMKETIARFEGGMGARDTDS